MTSIDLETKTYSVVPELQHSYSSPYLKEGDSHQDKSQLSKLETITKQIEDVSCKLNKYENRLDRLEFASDDISLKENPQSLERSYLKDYLVKGDNDSPNAASNTDNKTLAFLVPHKTSMNIDKLLAKTAVMRKLCSVEKISGDSLEYLTTNRSDATAGWVGESTIAETTSPKIYKTTIYLHEIYSQPQISKKLLEDSFIDLESWLITHLVDAFSRIENAAFIKGDGDKKPLGILSCGSGTEVGQIERVAVTQFNADAIIKLYYALNEYFASKGAFLMNRSVLQEVRSFKSSSGQYLLQRGPSGEELLMGMPVYQTSDMPLQNTTGTPIIAFGDFKTAYKIVENREINILRDPFTNKSFIKFYTTKRVGGSLVNGEAIKMLTVSTTR